MKIQLFFIAAAIVLIPASISSTPKAAYIWIRLGEGLHYTTYSFPLDDKQHATIHAFQVDPKKYKLDVLTANDEKEGATARELAARDDALIVINGGFFTPKHTSIGLIVKDGKRINKLHRTSWWSIFGIRNGRPVIFTPREINRHKNLSMALQVGPRLAIDGKIPKLKKGVATRSAVGITKKGEVVIAITSGPGVSMNEIARRMSATRFDGGLECPNAMALDGGSSSQLFAEVGNFNLNLSGLAHVTNGLAVKRK